MALKIAVCKLAKDCDLLKFYLLNSARYPFLLESVAKSASNYFDILFAFPGKVISSYDNFLQDFSEVWTEPQRPAEYGEEIPFHSGWFLSLSYELNLEIEPVLRHSYTVTNQNKSCAVRVHGSIVQDKKHNKLYFIAEDSAMLESMLEDFKNLSDFVEADFASSQVVEEFPKFFLDRVARIKDYILAGDVFQVNLSRLWQVELGEKINPGHIYDKLRKANPAPFAGLANFPDHTVISSSPERLLKLTADMISTRPIAGTRPRGKNIQADAALSKELLANPKEQAEHIMLIDLERNDLGRVCEPGTVIVDELMTLESYAHVQHIVSNVTGRIRKNISPIDVIRAVFPGGTITGCPKVRCMQIINELESGPRGVYTGSMGYLDLNGNMDLNILIRTLEQRDLKLSFRAGAGIVHDSVASRELQETRDKAEGMLRIFT